ncbi:hypothetical protein CYMTET_38513 [Cymbomonas tetramitiformis]|uniref:protein-S-isoprenylcysteine alpha-carbonyl methylesterase n=1 Tax=Cymbomonas tetramitiformis TaxID=36881 RepID=A0AAE0CBW8_9CHLO|nr:hypothetical protein CYMTET_38513 [Cymbomonas tetramitiformis]
MSKGPITLGVEQGLAQTSPLNASEFADVVVEVENHQSDTVVTEVDPASLQSSLPLIVASQHEEKEVTLIELEPPDTGKALRESVRSDDQTTGFWRVLRVAFFPLWFPIQVVVQATVVCVLWVWNLLRLVFFAFIMMPGFLSSLYFYLFSRQIQKGIKYGDASRNRLDVYRPKTAPSDSEKFPVLIFVTGGAWVLGHRAWGMFFGQRLIRAGIVVVSLDYRNFPFARNMENICTDVNTGISWVLRNLEDFQGDPGQVFLMGQSAGGMLTALTMLRQAERIANTTEHDTQTPALGSTPGTWDPRSLKGYIGVSGVYDCEAEKRYLKEERGSLLESGALLQ